MARVPTPGGFRQPALRPVAQPVDTYFQGKLVKPAEAVDNNVLQLTKGFAALSESLVKFTQDREKQIRELIPDEAAAAVESFGGTSDDLRGVALMDDKAATAWLKENQKLFGRPLDYSDRPDFLLQLRHFAGRRDAVPYAEKLYNGKDEEGNNIWDGLKDPEVVPDIQARLKELREEYLDGIDPQKGHHFLGGARARMAQIEAQAVAQLHGLRQAAGKARYQEGLEREADDLIDQIVNGKLYGEEWKDSPDPQSKEIQDKWTRGWWSLLKTMNLPGDRRKNLQRVITVHAEQVALNDPEEVDKVLSVLEELPINITESGKVTERLNESTDGKQFIHKLRTHIKRLKEANKPSLTSKTNATASARAIVFAFMDTPENAGRSVPELLEAFNGSEEKQTAVSALEKGGVLPAAVVELASDAASKVWARHERSETARESAAGDKAYKEATLRLGSTVEQARQVLNSLDIIGEDMSAQQIDTLRDRALRQIAALNTNPAFKQALEDVDETVMSSREFDKLTSPRARGVVERERANIKSHLRGVAEKDPNANFQEELAKQVANLKNNTAFNTALDDSLYRNGEAVLENATEIMDGVRLKIRGPDGKGGQMEITSAQPAEGTEFDDEPQMVQKVDAAKLDAAEQVEDSIRNRLEKRLDEILKTQDADVDGPIRARRALKLLKPEVRGIIRDEVAKFRGIKTAKLKQQRVNEYARAKGAGTNKLSAALQNNIPGEEGQDGTENSAVVAAVRRLVRADPATPEGIDKYREALDDLTIPIGPEEILKYPISGVAWLIEGKAPGVTGRHPYIMDNRHVSRIGDREIKPGEHIASMPSKLQAAIFVRAAALMDPSWRHKAIDWKDDGDPLSDASISMPEHEQTIRAQTKKYVLVRGLNSREVATGKLREFGLPLTKIFGEGFTLKEYPWREAVIGPKNTAEFMEWLNEFKDAGDNEEARQGTRLWGLMATLGISPQAEVTDAQGAVQTLSDGTPVTQALVFLKHQQVLHERREKHSPLPVIAMNMPLRNIHRYNSVENLYYGWNEDTFNYDAKWGGETVHYTAGLRRGMVSKLPRGARVKQGQWGRDANPPWHKAALDYEKADLALVESERQEKRFEANLRTRRIVEDEYFGGERMTPDERREFQREGSTMRAGRIIGERRRNIGILKDYGKWTDEDVAKARAGRFAKPLSHYAEEKIESMKQHLRDNPPRKGEYSEEDLRVMPIDELLKHFKKIGKQTDDRGEQ